MKVSIIIPVYNVEKLLSRCIESVLKQKNIHLELLLINDGSTDDSGNICDGYAKKDDRIRVFHQKNSGVSLARNIGIKNATGDWICFVDSDDWLETDSIADIIRPADFNETDLIIARSYVNLDGKTSKERYPIGDNIRIGEIYKGLDLFIEKRFVRGSVWGILYRRLFILENNILFPLNLKNGEDSIFYALCTIYADRIRFSNIHLYNVYEREGSASRSWHFDRTLVMVDNIRYIDKYIENHPGLSKNAINILNYSKYGVISNIYNNFYHSFSLKNYFTLRKKLKSTSSTKIVTGKIKTNKSKVRLLNFSLDLFALMVIMKSRLSSQRVNTFI